MSKKCTMLWVCEHDAPIAIDRRLSISQEVNYKMANRVFRVVLHQFYDGQICQNVLHFMTTDDTVTAETIAVDVRDNWVNLIKVHQSNVLRYTKISVQGLLPVLLDNYELALANTYGSWGGGPGAAGIMALCVTMRSGFGGRQNRGRFYVAGLPMNYCDLGRIGTGVVAGINTTLTNMINRYGAAANMAVCKVVILSRTRIAQGTQSIEDTFKFVSSFTPQLVVATMRKRKPGIGS